jgi:hypothetical protein
MSSSKISIPGLPARWRLRSGGAQGISKSIGQLISGGPGAIIVAVSAMVQTEEVSLVPAKYGKTLEVIVRFTSGQFRATGSVQSNVRSALLVAATRRRAFPWILCPGSRSAPLSTSTIAKRLATADPGLLRPDAGGTSAELN